jgi:hypothetical protein
MANLRDRCLSHLETLGIPLRPDTLDAALSKAEKESLPHLSFLDQLLGPPAVARQERAVERRIREARFAEPKTLEGFDWKFNPKAFDRLQIEELATGDFIRRRANLIFVGWSGARRDHPQDQRQVVSRPRFQGGRQGGLRKLPPSFTRLAPENPARNPKAGPLSTAQMALFFAATDTPGRNRASDLRAIATPSPVGSIQEANITLWRFSPIS